MRAESVTDLCHERFAAIAAAMPDAPAVIDGERVISYAELDRWSDRIAGWLMEQGTCPDDVVAVLADRTADLPTAVIGVWKAGAAYLALDPQTPRRRLRSIAAQLRPKAVLTQAGLRRRGGTFSAPMLLLDSTTPSGGYRRSPAVSPDNLAYVIHTSGSTGAPKGVGVSHRALTAITTTYQRMYGMGSDITRVLQLAGSGFDVATGDFARTLLTGACLVMCPAGTVVSPPDLLRLIRSSRAQYAEVTPSLLRPLVGHLAATGQRLDGLRYLIVGGELWTAAEHESLRAVVDPRVRVFNTYGLTETTIDSTFFETAAGCADDSVPIGSAFASTELSVLDGELCPAGEGELYLGGAQLARGYLGDPAATALRFVPAPGGGRMFRSGDLVRRRPDGHLVHLGRTDDVVKVRGVRVSLAEVRLALAGCPGVRAAAVDLVRVRGAEELAAYLVPRAGGLEPTEVRRFVAGRLGRAMVPAFVSVVPSFPVTANGKVDLAALRAGLVTTTSGEPSDIIGPGDTGGGPGQAIHRLWREVLGAEAGGDDDDFFELGGDSLRAAQLVERVRAELGVDLAAGALFEHPTLAELTSLAQRSARAETVPSRPGRDTGPLAPIQHRLWLLHQLGDGLAGYNIPVVLALRGRLDPTCLAAALRALVARHPALRTAFLPGPDGPVQRVHGELAFEVTEVEPGSERAAQEWITAEVRRPFDLSRPPLLRAALLTVPGDGHRLVLTMHHLVSDGQTVRVLLRELGIAYAALHAGREPRFSPLPLSYLDYSDWQAGLLRDGRHDEQLASWRERLGGCPTAPAFSLPAAPRETPGTHRLLLTSELTADLRELAREQRTTLFVLLLAGFAGLLHRWTGERDLPIGVPFGTRTAPGTRDLVGFFVNTAALRMTAEPGATFADLVRTARSAVAHAGANSDVPFDVVHHHLSRDGTRLTFTTWFNFLGEPDQAPQLPGVRAEVLDPPPAGALFDLNVYLTDLGARIAVDLVYDGSKVDGELAAALGEQYERLLDAVTAEPDTGVAEHALGADRDDTEVTGSGGVPVLASFAEQVRRHPDAVAVRGPDGDLTYAELASWAAATGAALTSAQVGPADVVAVYAPREPTLVAALLAAWSAGASFCVLDPAYPPERLAEQLTAAGGAAAALVATEMPGTLRDHLPVQIAMRAPVSGVSLPVVSGHPGHVGFTSGTTGTPRVVRASGLPLAHFLGWYASEFGLGPDDRFAMLSGLAHDPLLRDVFAPLTCGATLCVPPDDLLRDPRELRAWLSAEGVTVLHLTPQLLRLVAGAAGPVLDRLRLVVSAGDHLFAADVTALRAAAPGATVVNAYGATETPQVMACHTIACGQPAGTAERRIPIGSGIDGVRLRVARTGGMPAAVGEPGRVIVRTPYLADGLGDEYDTGDLGRTLPDGSVELLGRADEQLKIAGYRVEPQDVDAAVRRLGYIADCRTVASGGRLVVYAVCRGAVSVAALRSDLVPLLPPHMIPSGLVSLPAIPLTPNGKLDKSALPPWQPGDPQATPAQPAASALEHSIAEVWQSTLDCASVSPEANFFDLGGTSLLMARAQAGLEARLGRPIPMLTLFEHPTVRSLAAHFAGTGAPQAPARRHRSPVSDDAPRRMLVRTQLRRGRL